MSELKTLKDIAIQHNPIDKDEASDRAILLMNGIDKQKEIIKQEAIKWIKHLQTYKWDSDQTNFCLECLKPFDPETCMNHKQIYEDYDDTGISSSIKTLKTFFNITDEEIANANNNN